MCYYVTVAVGQTASASLERLRREYGYRMLANENSFIGAHLAADARVVIAGQCSCHLIPSEPVDSGHKLAAAERKYRALGWSEAKVSRALAAKAADAPKEPPYKREADKFRRFLRDLSQTAGQAHVLVHFYQGNTRDERFTFAEPVAIAAEALAADDWRYPEDRVVTVIGEAAEQ